MKSDCSQFCCGAVMTQQNELGENIQLYMLQRNCLSRETHFSTVEKECLAILLALNNFERHILDVPVTIITDHNCLKWLMEMAQHNSRLMRRALYLQRYNIVDIKLKPGVNHTDAE